MNRGVIDYAHEVVRASRATGRRRLVLLALALHADEHEHARPSTATLGEWAGISRWNAFDALNALVEAREIACVSRSRGGRPSEYRILVLHRPGYEADQNVDRPECEADEEQTARDARRSAHKTASLTASTTVSYTGQEHNGSKDIHPPCPPRGNRRKDRVVYNDMLAAFRDEHFRGKPLNLIDLAVRQVAFRGDLDLTLENVRPIVERGGFSARMVEDGGP